jgi:hypothetical protein
MSVSDFSDERQEKKRFLVKNMGGEQGWGNRGRRGHEPTERAGEQAGGRAGGRWPCVHRRKWSQSSPQYL